MGPTLEEVITFVREFSGWHRKVIDENTWLENDPHIAGDDGVELLEEAEKHLVSASRNRSNKTRLSGAERLKPLLAINPLSPYNRFSDHCVNFGKENPE